MPVVKGLRFAGLELRNIFASKPVMIALVAVALIPLLYGALYLLAFMDPYERLNQVEVAIVNLDKGAEIDGEMRNVGNTAVDEMKKSESNDEQRLGWNFVSKAEADEGLKNGTYYMVCTIPADFTECVASASGDNPRKAEMTVEYNESKNMLAAQVGGSVWKEIRTRLSSSVSEEYWTTTFTKLNESADSIREAGEGAAKLGDGISTAASGSATIATNLVALHAGAAALESGLASLADGTSQVSSGASDLSSGLSKLSAGSGALSAGAADAATGASQLSAGVQTLVGKISGLAGQISDAAAAAGQIETGARGVADGASGVITSIDGLKSYQAGLMQEVAAGTKSAEDAIADYNTQSARVSAAVSGLATGASGVADGAALLKKGLAAASAEMSSEQTQQQLEALTTGAATLASGTKQVADGAAVVDTGAKSASTGADKLSAGAQQVAAGAASAKDGSGQITNGSQLLAAGANTLTEGLLTAVAGSETLSQALLEGADASRMTQATIDARSSVMSDPVELENDYYTTVKNYGTGFAPYFIGLGLWVGAIFSGFVLRPFNYRSVLSGGNSLSVAFSGFIPMAVISVIQSVLLLAALQFGLQLQIDNVPAFYGFGIFLGLVFTAIMQFLVAAFGLPGRFIAVIFLMLQLTSAAGTFPVEMSPDFFVAIHPFMPMTYSVDALRIIMTGLNYTQLGTDVAVLLGIAAVCFILTVLVVRKKRIVAPTDMHPLISIA